jgi:PAS domain S-box-containing protein
MYKKAKGLFGFIVKQKKSCYLALLVILLSFGITSRLMAIMHEEKNVLLIHSYHKGMIWADDITAGVEEVLDLEETGVDLHVEYMDTKRISGEQLDEYFYRLLRYKYTEMDLDAIITVDDYAFRFVVENREELFPNVPIVFCGVNFFEEAMLRGYRDITGLVESYDVEATMKVAKKLHPRLDNLFIINDLSITGRANKRRINEILQRNKLYTKVTYLDDVSMTELRSRLQDLPKDALVLLMTFNEDNQGNVFRYRESIALIRDVCSAPMYGVWSFYVGRGIVGGKVTSGYRHGAQTAEIVKRVLSGESVEKIPVQMHSDNIYMFDHNMLKTFGISRANLPEGSVIINQPDTFYARYSHLFWTALIILILLLAIILLLSYTLNQRHKLLVTTRKNEKQYSELANSITDIFFALDNQQRFSYLNNAAEEFFGVSMGELKGESIYDHLDGKTGLNNAVEIFEQVLVTGVFQRFTHELKKEGKTYYYEFNVYPSESGISVIAKDITVQQKTLHALDEEHKQLLSIFDSVEAIAYVADLDTYEILYSNPFLNKLLGTDPTGGICYQEFQGLDRPCHFCTNDIIKAKPEQTYKWEYHNPKIHRDYVLYDRVIKWPDGRDVRFEFGIDITDEKIYIQELQEKQRQLETLMSNLPGMAYRMLNQPEWPAEFISQGALELTGYKPEDLMMGTQKVYYNNLIHPEDRDMVWQEVQKGIENKKAFTIIYRMYDADKTLKWVWEKGKAILDEHDEVIALEGFIADITERKIAVEKLRQALNEKNVLLKEVHHRVKNNLQIISSILNMQSGYMKNEHDLELMRDCRNRIRSMAMIHEKLYKSKNLTKIDFKQYIVHLVSYLFKMYHKDNVSKEVSLDEVYLDINKAIPCGLILTELISNSLKYAYPGDKAGVVKIDMQKKLDKLYITIKDEGVGLPEDLELHNAGTLGLRLIDQLIDQLNGVMNVKRTDGAEFSFSFELNNPE